MNSNMLKEMFYVSVEFDRSIFADEADKFFLEKSITEMLNRNLADLYGYCILDNGLCVITVDTAKTCELVRGYLDDILQGLMNYKLAAGDEHVERIRLEDALHLSISELNSTKELFEALCYMHLLPTEFGYVSDPDDYWWSSVQAYQRDNSRQQGVNKDAVLHLLSDSKREAKTILRKISRENKRKHIPKPACLQRQIYHYDRKN